MLAGGLLISYVELRLLETAYALLLIGFAINLLRGTDLSKNLLPRVSYPVFGGFLSMLMHSGGPFFLRYCQLFSLNHLQTVGTIAVIHFSMNIFKAGFFTGSGLVEASYLYRLAPAYLVAIIGTRIGRGLLRNYVKERLFSLGIATLLLLLSIKYLL